MSRDVKNNRRSYPSHKGNSLLIGILIGALIGMGIAVGIVLFLNRSVSFFNAPQKAANTSSTVINEVNASNRTPEIMQPLLNNLVKAIDSSAVTQADASNVSAIANIDYDFYKVLSDNGDKKKKVIASQTEGQAILTQGTDNKKGLMSKKSYLQLGAFQSEQQADNLKAKLALVGIEAQIQSKDNGTGLLHRVRIGPFTSTDELIHMREQLKQNGIDNAVIGS